MNNELTALLHKAYNDGIITSIMLKKILKAKDDLKLSDAEYYQLDDQIRITTYLKKVDERKEKGVVYIGDLTKQYKITEEEKILLQEKKLPSQNRLRRSNKQSKRPSFLLRNLLVILY